MAENKRNREREREREREVEGPCTGGRGGPVVLAEGRDSQQHMYPNLQTNLFIQDNSTAEQRKPALHV